jgi:hypothetical protein
VRRYGLSVGSADSCTSAISFVDTKVEWTLQRGIFAPRTKGRTRVLSLRKTV